MLKIKLTHGAEELKRGSEYSTGLDLKAKGVTRIINNKLLETQWNFKEYPLQPFERVLINTGVQIECDSGGQYMPDIQIRNRSGLTLKDGILCQLGTIDYDYRGDIGLSIINLSNKEYTIKENQALAQLVIGLYMIPKVEYVEEINETVRGNDGFGSTDTEKYKWI